MAEINNGSGFTYHDLLRNLQKKPVILWVILGLIGLGFVLLLNGNDLSQQNRQSEAVNIKERIAENSAVATRQQLESELARTLRAIAGVGEVRVELNLKSGNRKVWERQLHISKRVSQEQGVMNTEESNNDELVIAKGRDGQDAPILKEELAPEIQGVLIVATGASDVRIKDLLTTTVMTILNLPAHRVLVIPGSIEEEVSK